MIARTYLRNYSFGVVCIVSTITIVITSDTSMAVVDAVVIDDVLSLWLLATPLLSSSSTLFVPLTLAIELAPRLLVSITAPSFLYLSTKFQRICKGNKLEKNLCCTTSTKHRLRHHCNSFLSSSNTISSHADQPKKNIDASMPVCV